MKNCATSSRAFDSKAEILYETIPFSKTDQLGHKTTLILKRSVHASVCPVNLMLNYFTTFLSSSFEL
jgi:hypothetical protein